MILYISLISPCPPCVVIPDASLKPTDLPGAEALSYDEWLPNWLVHLPPVSFLSRIPPEA